LPVVAGGRSDRRAGDEGDDLFPAEQARIVYLMVERVDVRMHGVDVRLRPNGLAGLVRDVAGGMRAAG
jgi:site-specific DNA recombinase